jgi:flagellar biosynthesis protein FlhG
MTPPPATAVKIDGARKPRIIAIASGKGGVGKTWLSLTLAQALGQRKARVLVFDADLGLANADIQLGHLPERDLSTVFRGEASLSEVIIKIPEGGFDLIAGQSGSGALAGLDRAGLDRLLAGVATATGYDIVVLDLAAGLDDAVRRFTALADTVLLVITEDPASLTDAYAVLKLLQADRREVGLDVDVRVVVNQASNADAGKRAHAALARAARGFLRIDPPLIGVINRDERVPDAIRQQKLLLAHFPQARASSDVQIIARRLIAKP